MPKPVPRRPYSYRADPNVPPFDDARPLIIFDGMCVLCAGGVQWMLARDPDGPSRFAAIQEPIPQALYRHFGLDTAEFETNLVLIDGRAYAKLDTVAAAAERLGGGWRLLGVLRAIPRPIADWLYDRIAHNRYRLFGRTEHCMMPPPEWRERFIE